jgi:hypothetical protein
MALGVVAILSLVATDFLWGLVAPGHQTGQFVHQVKSKTHLRLHGTTLWSVHHFPVTLKSAIITYRVLALGNSYIVHLHAFQLDPILDSRCLLASRLLLPVESVVNLST